MMRTAARAVLAATIGMGAMTLIPTLRPADAGAPRVLILDSTVSGGMSSTEAARAVALGFSVDLVDATAWGAMTTADFAAYEGIILGDPNCSGISSFQPAIDNVDVWTPAIDGNTILLGTDPNVHLDGGISGSGGQVLTDQGVGFALDGSGDTGLYLTLSCSGGDPGANDLLSGFGVFETEPTSCDDDIHIVASHPAIADLTDGDLADWGCSTHEGFTLWPTDRFQVLALAKVALDPVYTADDGTQGNPYILASGEGLEPIRAVTLAPEAQSTNVGMDCTVTVSLVLNNAPVAAGDVTVEVTDGPQAGKTGTVTTDAAGEATFSYTGTAAGTDTLLASYDNSGNVLTSNEATCTFAAAGTPPPAVAVAGAPNFTG